MEQARWEIRWGISHALTEDDETQAELAGRMGMSPSKLSRWISGETAIRAEDIRALAVAQGRTLDWYYYGIRPSEASSLTRPYRDSALAFAS